MQRLEVSGVVRPLYGSLGVKRLSRMESCLAVKNTQLSLFSRHIQLTLSQITFWKRT